MACEIGHAILRMRPDLLDARTFLGIQDAGPDMPPLVLINCVRCRSTLALQMPEADAADLWVRARCRPGYVIQDDDKEIAPVRGWIPGALARQGLHLEQVPGGWRCCSTGIRRTPTALQLCMGCGERTVTGAPHLCPGAELIQ